MNKSITRDEFHQNLIHEVLSESRSREIIRHQAFFEIINEELIDSGELTHNYNYAFLKDKKIEVSGFSYDEERKILSLIVSEYFDEDEIVSLVQKIIDSKFKRLRNFLFKVIDDDYKDFANNEVYSMANNISEYLRTNEVDKFKLYLITNGVKTRNLKRIESEIINNIKTEFRVIDLDYCYSNYLSSLKGGDIEIETSLPCLEIDSNNPEYSSFLAVMSGSQLVEIYEEYGQKLLEQNVRTFLMFRTKVNQGLKETIRKIPERFFAYNNGITGTASEVQIVNGKITKLKGFQIVNGGQTTSSIYYCAKNENFDISAVNVQLKLSVIKENEKHTDFVDSVAKYANTQNAIKDADFSSNSPFHIQFKQWSKRVLVPSVDGSQNRTYWHYERVRGEYLNDQAYLEPSRRKKFILDHPNRITKINLPMSEVSWMQKPDIVSKKSGAAFKFFGAKITDEIAKDNLFITEDYYKDVISRVIMYRDVRKLIQNSSWYETGSYLAATVTYSMSFLAFEVSKTGQYFNFKKIWEIQSLPTALEQIFKNITSKVYASIHKPEEGYPNLDSWHKRTGCFDKVKKDLSDIKIMKLDVFLVTKDIVKTEKKDQRKDRKFVDAVTKHMFVVHEEGENKKLWASLLEFYREDDNPTVMKLDILTKFTTGLLLPKKISRKQAVVIYDIYENAKENGWIEHD